MILVFSNMGTAVVEVLGQLLREGSRLAPHRGGVTEQELVGVDPQTSDVLHGVVIGPRQGTGSPVGSPYAGFDDRGSER